MESLTQGMFSTLKVGEYQLYRHGRESLDDFIGRCNTTVDEALEKARLEGHDSSYDEGWAARGALHEADRNESRLEGFQEGYNTGFKSGVEFQRTNP